MSYFVGRGPEVAWLEQRLRAAASGSPQTVVVDGPPGIGKTALVDAFASRLDPAHLLRASGDEDETSLPFGLVHQLVGPLAEEWDDPFVAGADLLRLLDARSEAPTVFLVDDAHLADPVSLRALSFALRRLRADRVLAVFCVPDHVVARLPAGLVRLASASDNHLHVGGLSEPEVAELVRAAGHEAPTRSVVRLRRHTGGNPLHLVALLREAPEAALTLGPAALPAPQSFARVVLGQLAGLGDAAQALARAASVLPDDAPLPLVAGVAGLDADDPATTEAAELLDRSGLVRCRDAGAGWTLRFGHPLVRATVHDDSGPATRSALHARAAGRLTGEEALLHRVAAGAGNDPDLSDALAAFAEDTLQAGRTGRAAELMLTAARAAPPGPRTDERLLEALNLFLMDGDIGSAKELEGTLGGLAPTAQRLYLRAKVAWLAGRPTDAEDLALQAWDREGELGGHDRGGLAAILAQLCNLRGDGAAAATWSDRALALGLPPDLVDSTEAARAVGLTLAGQVHLAVAALDGLPTDAATVASHGHRLTARGALRLATDDVAGAAADLGLVCEVGEPLWPQRMVAMGVLAELDYRAGRWDESLALAEQAVSLAEDGEQEWVLGYLHCTAVLTTAARGSWAEAESHLDAARQLVERLGDPATFAVHANATVHLAACRDDAATAVEIGEQLYALGGPPVREPGFLEWPGQYVGALVELGRTADAVEVLAELEEPARARESRSRLAVLARVRGELATAQRDHSSARDAFEESVRLGEGVAPVLEQALAQASYGRFLRRRGERRAAVARLEDARDRLASLGAAPFLRRCEEELAACGARPGERPQRGLAVLTPQEQMVTGLACTGLTNAEIARRLVLSTKTVSYHLGNVYTKLGVHSRAQLVAAWDGGPPVGALATDPPGPPAPPAPR